MVPPPFRSRLALRPADRQWVRTSPLAARYASRISSATPDPARFFGEKHASYDRFIRFVRYPQGLHAFFMASPLLGARLRVLDAGCGTGAVTIALASALRRRGLAPGALHAFDLTPAMLERFRESLRMRGLSGVETAQANVLELGSLPAGWANYDLVVSASMLEYVPRDRLAEALRGLRGLLGSSGRLVLFITRRNWLTRPLIGRWWRSNLYGADELRDAFRLAGFSRFDFVGFPPAARHLSVWGHVIEAQR